MEREETNERVVDRLTTTVKRQKEQLTTLTSEFEESSNLVTEVNAREQANLKAEVGKMRKQLLQEMQNRSGAHEKFEETKAKILGLNLARLAKIDTKKRV